ncbi:TetR/AcrR family transcriptional regulator [Microlunatus soli]|uniref:DNA-binding transcriptional regulator, AcrR family n=1 Tax=Microlunatus soli TaxID=630515 RepID=A0A1H1UYU3_9ACTN|nr:TetR/AcrR family transcriptional regulator [Microlunatus soli]SDS77682.1 DNA-binding transcriptional regulator, AcrR family [Microlunatus soli]
MTVRARTLPSGEPRPQYNLDRLLAVAVEVFTERGYDGTSFQHLSRASGLSKSSIYHHIDSKEQLLRLALEYALDPLMSIMKDEAATTGRALDQLTYVIRRAIEILADRLPYVALLLSVHGNTDTERWALEQRRTFDRFVADIVRRAVDDGDLRSELDPKITARLILGTINSLTEWYRPNEHHSPAELAAQISSLILDGLRPNR